MGQGVSLDVLHHEGMVDVLRIVREVRRWLSFLIRGSLLLSKSTKRTKDRGLLVVEASPHATKALRLSRLVKRSSGRVQLELCMCRRGSSWCRWMRRLHVGLVQAFGRNTRLR
jgi:hypothetical protein